MGQKVNPHGLRVGVIKDWDSKWYAEKDFADNLVEDHKIRKFLKNKLYSAGVSKIEIERASDRVKVVIHTAKPGVVIGKGGAEIEKVKAQLAQFTKAYPPIIRLCKKPFWVEKYIELLEFISSRKKTPLSSWKNSISSFSDIGGSPFSSVSPKPLKFLAESSFLLFSLITSIHSENP